ncbi:MAG: hypothetical protein ABSA17_08820 [Rhabdochlamydiaceae bacterium]|jgi:hypothetical protein
MKIIAALCLSIVLFGFHPGFQYDVSVSPLENRDEFLVRFKIDKVLEDRGLAEFTAPQLLCKKGEEAVVTKSVDGNGYTVKGLVEEKNGQILAHITVVIREKNEVVYSASEDFFLKI